MNNGTLGYAEAGSYAAVAIARFKAPRLTAPKVGELFQIDGGDGDQSFFGEPRFLRLTKEGWFPGSLPGWGEAFLFLIEGGPYSGVYVAASSKTDISVVDKILRYGGAGVVVHLIKNPTISFKGNHEDFISVGMAFMKRI